MKQTLEERRLVHAIATRRWALNNKDKCRQATRRYRIKNRRKYLANQIRYNAKRLTTQKLRELVDGMYQRLEIYVAELQERDRK